jgi:hypothetical protein
MKADVDQKSGGLKADLTDRSDVPPSGVGASIVRSRLYFKYTLLFVMVQNPGATTLRRQGS